MDFKMLFLVHLEIYMPVGAAKKTNKLNTVIN